MFDKIEKIGNSIIHYGKSNNRVYLLKLDPEDAKAIQPKLENLAESNHYTKIIAKIPAYLFPDFRSNDYSVEAFIPNFYKGKTDCLLVAKFLDNERARPNQPVKHRFSNHFSTNGSKSCKPLPPGYEIRQLSAQDAENATHVFKSIFETYPFPIYDPEYIRDTMAHDQASYFGVWDQDRLIGVSTAETDFQYSNAEMTDFAVLPSYRGKSLAYHLLQFMEEKMKVRGIKTVYTIARMNEAGMNFTFLKAGYKYSGALINNTNIGGSIESMNIYYKHL